MAGNFERTQPGYRDNLDPWQQQALFDLWDRFFRLCQIPPGTDSPTSQDSSPSTSPWKASLPSSDGESSSSSSTRKPLRRENLSLDAALGIGEHAFHELRPSASTSSQPAGIFDDGTPPKDDVVKVQVQGQLELREMRKFLHKYGGQRLRKVFWQMVKGEHPDAIMLRFLRARKWDIDRALAILGAIAAWRVEEKVEEIVLGGDAGLVKTRGGMNAHMNGISYAHGAAINGEPIYIIEVGNHYSSSQTQEELKQKIILDQEILGSLMAPPVERKVVIFNMLNFSLRNMDYWCVFYLVKSMQKYPETLARVYVHGAPWIFKPVWAILRPLLDPVVREKIRLTSDIKELEEYIPLDRLPKESMKGEMDWAFHYQPPLDGETNVLQDPAKRDALQEEYFTTCFQLERATRAVARCLQKFHAEREEAQTTSPPASGPARYDRHHPPSHQEVDDASSIVGGGEWDEPEEMASLKAKRDVLATKLRVTWLQLRPYMAGTTIQGRWQSVRPDGTIVWRYPKMDGTVEEQVLGEETSLPALSKSLDVICQSLDSPPSGPIRSNVTSKEDKRGKQSQSEATPTAPSSSDTGFSGLTAPQSTSNGSPAALTEENLSYINGNGHASVLPEALIPPPRAGVVEPSVTQALPLPTTGAATDADSTSPLPPSSVRAEESLSSTDTLRGAVDGGSGSVRPLSVGLGAPSVETPPTSVSSVEDQVVPGENRVPVHPLIKGGEAREKKDGLS